MNMMLVIFVCLYVVYFRKGYSKIFFELTLWKSSVLKLCAMFDRFMMCLLFDGVFIIVLSSSDVSKKCFR